MIQHKGVHGLLVALAAAVTLVLAVSGTAQATPLYFAADSNQTPTGFSLAGGMPSPVDHVVPDGATFLTAGIQAGVDIQLEGQIEICVMTSPTPACGDPLFQGDPYYGILTLSLAESTVLPEGGLLLWITGMWTAPSTRTYTTTEVSIASEGPPALESISYIDEGGSSHLYYGVHLNSRDDQLIFRFDVATQHELIPGFFTNAYAVPEPSTGLLLGLGLVGLAANRRR